MTEEKYRVVKAILLAVLVVGTLWFACSMAKTYKQQAENGRFVLYAPYKESLLGWRVIDTRTGEIKRVKRKE